MTLSPFLTLQEAADLLGKSTQTVRRLIKKGELFADRIETPQGFQYSVPRESLVKYLRIPRIALTDAPRDESGELLEQVPPRWMNPVETPSFSTPLPAPESYGTSVPASLHVEMPQAPVQSAPLAPAQHLSIDAREEPSLPSFQQAKILERHHREVLGLLELLDHLQAHVQRQNAEIHRLSDQTFRLSILTSQLSSQLSTEQEKNRQLRASNLSLKDRLLRWLRKQLGDSDSTR